MNITTLPDQPVSILRAKSWKVLMECKIVKFFNFWAFFLRMRIVEVATFYPINSTLSAVVCIEKINVFDEAFFSLSSHCYYT